MTLLLMLACNHAPLDYRDRGLCMHPTDDRCADAAARGEPVVEASGLLLCATDNGIVPVDDPFSRGCSRVTGPGDAAVLHVFDGNEARAYAISHLLGRELVHDTLSGEAVVVDF